MGPAWCVHWGPLPTHTHNCSRVNSASTPQPGFAPPHLHKRPMRKSEDPHNEEWKQPLRSRTRRMRSGRRGEDLPSERSLQPKQHHDAAQAARRRARGGGAHMAGGTEPHPRGTWVPRLGIGRRPACTDQGI
eukprot:553277-Alexandrium_andersonii.AAC.1